MTTTTSSVPPPASLGRYRVVRRLGSGGMAEVFLAKSTGAEGIEKVLVVKRILPTFARSVKFISMFVDEAKVAMRLNHPNIVQVYAFEQVRDEFLLAMEFVDGIDLGRLVAACRRKAFRMPHGIAALAVMEVAKGLDYAHNRKDENGEPMEIVHRDVSPQNVLLSYDGGVKVADFGIARARMVSEETGVIKGKFSYMSPEQARGERVDRRSDVYSLGVLLAELLMGRVMYPDQQGLDVLEQVRQAKVTHPRSVDPAVPETLDAIVRKATDEDRNNRYPTARALAGALGQYLHDQEEVYDGEAIERLIARVVPREVTSPDVEPRRGSEGSAQAASAAPSSARAMPARELRERRHVVVVAGIVRGRTESSDPSETPEEHKNIRVGDEAARVLADIAYKADAVLSWPDGADRRRFRFILGLGRATVLDPLKAAELALDVLEALQGLAADMAMPLTASIGMSRGVVSTTRDSAGRLLRYEPIGRVLEVAEKLAGHGGPSEVLAAGEVYRLVRRAFVFDEDYASEVDLGEGDTSPRAVKAHRLRSGRTRKERGGTGGAVDLPGSAGLIGRVDELSAIETAYEEAIASGHGVCLAVIGELGVGKTALVSAAIESLSPKPRVLHTECAYGTSDVPFAATADLVREALGIVDDTTADAARALLRRRATELVADREERNAMITGLEPLVVPIARDRDEGEDHDHSAEIVRAFRGLVRGIASRGPLVVWVDALQWADSPSAELLASLGHRGLDVPILWVLATRPDARIDPVVSSVPRVEVPELADDERVRLIRAKFEGAQVPAEIERAIVDRAGGNPFFLIELVEALLDRGAVTIEGTGGSRRVVRKPGMGISLPTTLEGAVAARLSELPEEQRHAIRWLAAVGPGFRVEDLSELAGIDVASSLRALERRGLLGERPAGVYFFPSAVVRHVAYETTDEDDRVRMHRRIGAHLASLGAAIPPARIARHLERAGDRPAAADAYLSAAQAARLAYSNREALRFYNRAVALLPADSARRFRAFEAREQILRGMGRRREQLGEIEAMRAFSERHGDAPMRALANNRLARYELDIARTSGVEATLEKALSSAIEAEDRGAEVEALRLTAVLSREQGDHARGLELCERALARAGFERELLAARGSVLVQKAILLRRMGKLDEGIEAIVEAIVIFRRLGIKRNEAYALNSLGVGLASMGEFEDAITVLRESIEIDCEIGDRFHLGVKVSNVGQLYAEIGEVEMAEQFLKRSLAVFDAVEDQSGRCDALSAIAELTLDLHGDFDAARRLLEQSKRTADRAGDRYDQARERIVRCTLEMRAGNLDLAVECAREGLRYATEGGVAGYELLASASLAEALALRGEQAEARELIRKVRERVRSRGVVERAERIHLAIARTLSHLGETHAAESAYAEAALLVESRLGHIRSVQSRQRYISTRTVQSIRQST